MVATAPRAAAGPTRAAAGLRIRAAAKRPARTPAHAPNETLRRSRRSARKQRLSDESEIAGAPTLRQRVHSRDLLVSSELPLVRSDWARIRSGDAARSGAACALRGSCCLGQFSSRLTMRGCSSNIVAMVGGRNYWPADADTGAPEILSANSRGSRRMTSLKMFRHLGHSYASISCRFRTGVTPISALSTLHTMQMGSAFMAADPFQCRWFDGRP